MRTALLDSPRRDRAGTSRPGFVAAPVKGWNTRDALASLDPLSAPVLTNWFPRQGQLELRGGYGRWRTGVTSGVKSLHAYNPTSGTIKMFAASDSGIFDVTTGGGGSAGAAVSACTNGYWHSVVITNSAGTSYLWLANGTDNPKYYDGAVWANPAITGPTAANIIFPCLFKHRIFFLEKTTMNLWFLPLDSIQGAAQKLPLGNLFHKGGYLVSMSSWTLDSGEGPDDLLAAITSEGQLAVFQGVNPLSASAWQLVGVWDVGKPLSPKCFFKLGGDVCVMVNTGVYPLSRLLQSGAVNYRTALTNAIQPTVSETMASVPPTTQGWKGLVYPAYDALLVNIPGKSQQWGMNTVTGALCMFSGWAATDFLLFNDKLYFGDASGNVNLAWDGIIVSDNSSDIVSVAHCAPSDFGQPTTLKKIELFRPQLSYDGPVELQYGMSVDLVDTGLHNTILRTASVTGATWNVSPWDTSDWAASITRQNAWRTVDHFPGYSLALWLQTASNGGKLYWSGTNYVIGIGNML